MLLFCPFFVSSSLGCSCVTLCVLCLLHSALGNRRTSARHVWVCVCLRVCACVHVFVSKCVQLSCWDSGSEGRSVRQCDEHVSLVQRLLFYPEGRVHVLAPPVLTTQHVLAELRWVDSAPAWRRHAEALLEQTLQDLQGWRGGGISQVKIITAKMHVKRKSHLVLQRFWYFLTNSSCKQWRWSL